MNRRERRYGRMYLLPLLLALTGLALLVLEWVLRMEGFGGFEELDLTIRHNILSLLYPVVLMFLFVFRIPPKTARIFSIVSLGLSLLQFIFVLYCMKKAPTAFMLWIPGHMFLAHVQALQIIRSAQNVLLTCADACFILSSLSAVFTCLMYAYVKTYSDCRNAAFDRKYAYLAQGVKEKPTSKQQKQALPPEQEATRIIPVPQEFLDDTQAEH